MVRTRISIAAIASGAIAGGMLAAVAVGAQSQLPDAPICQVNTEVGLVYCQRIRQESWTDPEAEAELGRSSSPVAATSDYNRFLSLGRSRFDAGDVRGAIAFYTQAIETNSNLAEGYALRGTAYLSSNNPQQAIADYSLAIELGTGDRSRDAANHLGRGMSHQRAGNTQEAIVDATTAISLNPSFAAAYSLRGQARGSLRDLSGACADWHQAAQLYRSRQESDRYSDTLTYIRASGC